MFRSEMVARIVADTGLDTYAVDCTLQALLALAAEELTLGNPVRLTGFGKFEIIQRKQTRRRNPKTGDVLTVPARLAVSFHPSANLTKRLNENGAGDGAAN